MAECILNPASQDVADFIYRFGSLQNNLRDPEQFPCVDYVSNDYAVFYTELENALPLSLERQPYYSIPSLFTLLDDSAMEAAGIVSALQTPALSNMGSGVIIGIVDTGIDYTSPVFRKSDGTTRILGLWDQTLPEDPSVLPPGVRHFPGRSCSRNCFPSPELHRRCSHGRSCHCKIKACKEISAGLLSAFRRYPCFPGK